MRLGRFGLGFSMIVASAICAIPVRAQQASAASPREQLTQYVAYLQKNPSDDATREKIIKLALTIDPKPSIPPDAYILAGKGKGALKDAQSDESSNPTAAQADLSSAADSFSKASLAAPWAADFYLPLANVLRLEKHPQQAITNYKLYLLAEPNAPNAANVYVTIGELENEVEKRQAADTAAKAQRQAELDAQRTRERAAEQDKEQQEREEQQRLANLDPLVRSLKGAVYRAFHRDSAGNAWGNEWTINGDKVTQASLSPGNIWQYVTYPIDGKQFFILWSDTDPNDSCWRFYRTNNCGWLGTISEKMISFDFVADGKATTTAMGTVGGDAKRVK